jgi:hypothetical protein
MSDDKITFTNLKDDNERLNDHTEVVLQELSLFTKRMQKADIDSRAVFSGLAIFKNYYEALSRQRLGDQYTLALEVQSQKLSDEMLARDTRK